ncbi:MAG: ammonia channel protein [Candidatus Melainabacteria bacterium GWF2_37_15]|nr:MAG: ammonia channel protein [Candidatus Melainabacteria bacterium GWF2_37_15]
MNQADTVWILISSALVLLMTPGLALFYGGMVRRKNVLGTIMHSFIAMGVATVVWVLYGYSLAFGPDIGHVIGNLTWAGLAGVGLEPNPTYSATVPHQAFMLFQMMFAIITPALITGAFAERFKFKTYILFLVLWLTFVYAPIVHWVWGENGWLRNMGVLDFAGGLVVHISSGAAALAAALMVGKRKDYSTVPMPPHNLVLTILGTGLLWFGWFGFNGGSSLAANATAVNAIVVTHISSAFAAISWMIVEWIHRKKPTVLGAATGAVAGLASITPAAGFVGPTAAIIVGLVAGMICYVAVNFKTIFGYDDTLDVVGVHGVGSTWGMIATGLFAVEASLDAQFTGVIVTWIFAFVATLVIMKVLDLTLGLRVSEEGENIGLDLCEHGERGYTI